MDIEKGKWTKNLIIKAWKRCSTLPRQSSSKASTAAASLTRSKSWSSSSTNNTGTWKQKKNKAKTCKVAPVGCFTVYVGPEKQRFVVRMEFVNHPLFKTLLEDAALEYGYKSDGPILLPCDVDLFCNVLAQMESDDIDEDMVCFSSTCSPISFSPARRRNNCGSNRGYGGSYRMLTPTSSSSSMVVA